MSADDTARRDENLGLVKEAFAMISTGRYADVGSLVSEDLLFELPYGPGRKALEVRGRDAFLSLNEKTWPAFRRFEIGITQVHPLLDPDKLILEYRSEGEIIATGKTYSNRYVGIFGFRGGKICEWHEFHNPDVPAYAFSPDP